MQIESVSYMFVESELAALVKLLQCSAVPHCAIKADAEAGLARLEKSQLITRCGEQWLADKLAVFLVKTICSAERYVCMASAEAYVGLFYTPEVTLLLAQKGERWVITPFQTLAQGRQALMESAGEHRKAAPIVLKNIQGEWSCEPATAVEMRRMLSYAAQWMYFDETPKGKEATLWKP